MAGETTITVIGNLTNDPELKFTPSGAAVAEFTIASTPRSFDRQRNEWVDGDALFIRCKVWRDAAENVADTLGKGMRVIVNGNLRVRQYERRDGSKGTSVELDVQEVGPSLRFASATVNRTARREQPRQTQERSGWDTQPAAASSGWGSGPAHEEPPF